MSKSFACRLSHRGVLRVAGADARGFLQGLLSNDMNVCTQAHPLYAALLTPQGKFLHDVFVHDTGDGFLLDAQAARLDDLLNRLTRYKLRAAVTLANVSLAYDVVASFTPLPPWRACDTAASDFQSSHHSPHRQGGGYREHTSEEESPPLIPPASGGEIRKTDPRLPTLGSRFIAPKNSQTIPPPLAGRLDDYTSHCLFLGIPEGGLDIIPEVSTLAEVNLDLLNAISFTKGCYVGQELTARMRYRGLVKKRLFPVTITGDAPDFDAPIYSGTDEVGVMRSTHGNLGLALLKIDAAEQAIATQTPLTCGASKLTPQKPEWMKG